MCPKNTISITCHTYSMTLSTNAAIATTHTCELFYLTFYGKYQSGKPTCLASAQVDEQMQASQQYSREQFLTTHRPRKDPPPLHNKGHWPAPPTSNWFPAVDNSSRSRSHSPGHQHVAAETTIVKPATQLVASAPSSGLKHKFRQRQKNHHQQ